MHVKINYPDRFPLQGWDKGIFGIRVTSMFTRKYLSVNTLDDCRKSAGFVESNDALRNDLHALHCIDFEKLPKEVVNELPNKVGQYVGVELRRVRRPFSRTALVVAGCVMGLVGVPVAVGFSVPALLGHSANARESAVPKALDPSVPMMPSVEPVASTPLTADPVFSASITTTTPRKTIERIAAAIPASGATFDVSVSVTPSLDTAQ